MNPLIVIFPDLDSLSLAIAKQFSDATLNAVQQRGQALVALSGGSTPLSLFHKLAGPPFAAQIPWESMHFFWCDERSVPPDDPQSNYAGAHRALFRPLNLPEKNLCTASQESLILSKLLRSTPKHYTISKPPA